MNFYNRQKLEERLSKLPGSVAVIKVGAPMESEMKEKKNRVEAAINTIRAAYEEGITYDGGLAYLKAIPELQELENAVSVAGMFLRTETVVSYAK
jgi:chaperonin GroEL